MTHVYSLPGSPMYATLGACAEAGLTVVGCRSQFGALSAAMAHNYQAGKFCAVALCSPAPGVTNCITSLSDARSNRWPMLLIGGVVEPIEAQSKAPLGETIQGPPRFQSFDGAAAVAPCCKAVVKLEDRAALTSQICEALELAQTRPCGPVFVEVGPSVLNARCSQEVAPAAKAKPAASSLAIPQFDQAQRPVLILGEDLRWHSAATADRIRQLQSLLEHLQLPVLATDMGRGILADDHRLSVFLAKEEALKNCDHLLLCGAPLDWRFGARNFLGAKVPVEHVHAGFEHLLTVLSVARPQPGRVHWVDDLAQVQECALTKLRRQAEAGEASWAMNALCEVLGRWVPKNAVTILESGLALSSGHKFWPVQQPFARMTAGQNGTMGLGIPFALGAALRELQLPRAHRRPVVALVGDLGVGLAAGELETATRTGAKLLIIVADNGGINGRDFQDNWFPVQAPDAIRYSARVDYAQVARGWGAGGVKVSSAAALKKALATGLGGDGPMVISVAMAAFAEDLQHGSTGENDGI
jgi:2-hydroxyacyl-CoA lyase 1